MPSRKQQTPDTPPVKAPAAPTPADPLNGVNVRRRRLSEYKRDPDNANKGSARGKDILEKSLSNRGAGRSMLVDADDTFIAGNQTADVAEALGYTEVIEVDAPPNVLLVRKRSDLDLDDPDDHRARQLAYDDNRSRDHAEWVLSVIESDWQEGVDMSDYFDAEEIEEMLDAANAEAQVDAALGGGEGGGAASRGLTMDKARQIKAVLYVDGVAIVEQALKATGLDVRGDALVTVCRFYVEAKGNGNAVSANA